MPALFSHLEPETIPKQFGVVSMVLVLSTSLFGIAFKSEKENTTFVSKCKERCGRLEHGHQRREAMEPWPRSAADAWTKTWRCRCRPALLGGFERVQLQQKGVFMGVYMMFFTAKLGFFQDLVEI